ncbi:hypothetical protein [Nocardia asiatica]|uniref:hypothetical protein n=1 Tax=Nocardia asiatica TaxID=209252 RepID=UPI003EE08AC3
MKVHAVRLFITVWAAVTAATLTPQAPNASAVQINGCTFWFLTGELTIKHKAVLVSGVADCMPAPEIFHVALTLQYRPRGGGWQVRGAETEKRLPDPRLNVAAWAPCEPGLWKAVANVSGRARGKNFNFSKDTPDTIVTNC